jgi:UbiD family decarboxylase
MVRGKVTGLPFPAGAEIVLEGYVTPDKKRASRARSANGPATMPAAPPCTVLDVKAIYHRNDPICSACRRWAAGRTRWRATAR